MELLYDNESQVLASQDEQKAKQGDEPFAPLLLQACIESRAVLSEALLGEDLDLERAESVVAKINKALILFESNLKKLQAES